MFPKENRIRDPEHLSWIRTLPCLKCFESGNDLPAGVAHHITIGAKRSMALKAGDDFLLPVCFGHHHALHTGKGESSFWGSKIHKINDLANNLYKISGDQESAMQLIKDFTNA